MRYKNFIKTLPVVTVILLFLSCSKTNKVVPCDGIPSKAVELKNLCSPHISAYYFGVEHLPAGEQIKLFQNQQIDGIVIQIESQSVQLLNDYLMECAIKRGLINLNVIFTTVSLHNPDAYKIQLSTIDYILKKIQHSPIQLAILFDGQNDSLSVLSSISTIADLANQYQKEIILYPHEGTTISSAENALGFIQSAGKSNVFLSVHLCHELAAGNSGRMNEVISNVANYIKWTSISGATLSE